jgi:3-deoxy-D-manno-octulosonate 8-phosphate phosphatase KdsC-like HAD superfamily phosphatase
VLRDLDDGRDGLFAFSDETVSLVIVAKRRCEVGPQRLEDLELRHLRQGRDPAQEEVQLLP